MSGFTKNNLLAKINELKIVVAAMPDSPAKSQMLAMINNLEATADEAVLENDSINPMTPSELEQVAGGAYMESALSPQQEARGDGFWACC
jgi:hypothetical protein